MFFKIKNYKSIVVWIISLFTIFVFYSNVIISPNSVLFYTKNDAIKNYYTYKYYIDKNESLFEFKGMNYPYYEDVIYTDAQPPIAFTFKVLSKIFPSIKNYDIAIMQYLILLSFIFSIFLFYKILIYLKINTFFSIAGAVSIVLLSPQFMRLEGHYSLAYSVFYPLIIYLLLKNENKYFNNFLIGITSFFTLLLHPYIGLSIFMFVSIINITKLFNKNKNLKEIFIDELIQAILPFVIFYILYSIIDTHTNRPTNPAGIYYYHSTFQGLLLPDFEPFKTFYGIFFHYKKQFFENIAFIGTASTITIIILIIMLIKKIKLKKSYTIPVNNKLLLFLLSSFIILLFSFGFPFLYIFPKLMDYISYLRQFRALGRFSWLFYYNVGIITIFLLNYFYNNYKTKIHIRLASILLLILFLSEAVFYQINLNKHLAKSKNYFDYNLENKYSEIKKSIDVKNYQAIIPIPFYHIGSENYLIKGSAESIANSMFLSYHLNIPVLGNMLSRTSIDEAKKSLNILLPEFYKKNIVKDLKNKKDFLLVVSKGNKDKNEKKIIKKAELILKTNDFSLYKINCKKLFEYKKYKEQIYSYFDELNDSIHNKNGFILSDTSKYFQYSEFKNNKSFVKKENRPSLYINKKKSEYIYEIPEGELNPNKKYILSFWFYNKGSGRTYHTIILEEHNGENNKTNWNYCTDARFSRIVKDNWSLIEFKFKPINKKTSYRLYLPKRLNGVDSIFVSSLLLRESGLDIFKNNKNILFYNNFYIENQD